MALRPNWTEIPGLTELGKALGLLNRQMREHFRSLPDAERRLRVRIVDATDDMLAEDDVLVFHDGGFDFNLMDAQSLAGRRFSFKLWDGATGTVVLTPAGSDLIDAAADYTLTNPLDCIVLIAGETSAPGTYGWIVERYP